MKNRLATDVIAAPVLEDALFGRGLAAFQRQAEPDQPDRLSGAAAVRTGDAGDRERDAGMGAGEGAGGLEPALCAPGG